MDALQLRLNLSILCLLGVQVVVQLPDCPSKFQPILIIFLNPVLQFLQLGLEFFSVASQQLPLSPLLVQLLLQLPTAGSHVLQLVLEVRPLIFIEPTELNLPLPGDIGLLLEVRVVAFVVDVVQQRTQLPEKVLGQILRGRLLLEFGRALGFWHVVYLGGIGPHRPRHVELLDETDRTLPNDFCLQLLN